MVRRLHNLKNQLSNKLNNNNHNKNTKMDSKTSIIKTITTNNNKLFEKLANLM
jgi:excinuclease UvrABC nuclease subunit